MVDIKKMLLLDSECYNDCTTYSDKFAKLAYWLLNEIDFVIGDKICKICEIEFYLFTDDHQDIYTHRNDDQSTPNKWYFHKKGNTYKGGTYKGLDITFGLSNKPAFGGILIRGLSEIDNEPINCQSIVGPCKSVDYILEHTNSENINTLVPYIGDVSDNTKKIYLKPSVGRLPGTIYKGVRVGLTFKYPEWGCKSYRFLTWKLRDVEKNRQNIVVDLLNQGVSAEYISKESGYSHKKLDAYKQLYESGKLLTLDEIKNMSSTGNNIVQVCGFLGI